MLGYDYSGYGCSTGTPSVSNTIADINACYQFLLQVKGKRPQDIVVYGQSVGSGPTCDLGASEKGLKGIVLHSPLMSGMHLPLTTPNSTQDFINTATAKVLMMYDRWIYSNCVGMREHGIAKAWGCMQCTVSVGMRVLSPNMNRWPGWMDIFPNITLLPKVEAKTLIMHVSSCTATLIVHPLALAPDAPLAYDLQASNNNVLVQQVGLQSGAT